VRKVNHIARTVSKLDQVYEGSRTESERPDVYFKMRDGIMYSYCRNFEGREISYVVIRKRLRETVMTMAHDALMRGHQGREKTKDTIWREFWWPGVAAEVTRFCR